MTQAPSADYFATVERTKAHHRDSKTKHGVSKTYSGAFIFKRRDMVKGIIDRLGIASLLDYGCGGGKQYLMRLTADGESLMPGQPGYEQAQSLEEIFGFETAKYDPCVAHYSADPVGPFDMVACVQIMNCIPMVDLPWVADRLYGLATKAIFISERLGRPTKQLHAAWAHALPYDYAAQDYLSVFRKPGSPIRLVCEFKEADGWRTYEPEDQGIARPARRRGGGAVAGVMMPVIGVLQSLIEPAATVAEMLT